MDSDAAPQLRFVEKNCVQCGLCANTCPEDAITLAPRMSFADTWNKAVRAQRDRAVLLHPLQQALRHLC